MGKERFKYLNPFSAILMTGITFAAVKTRDMKLLALLLPISYNTFDFQYIFLQKGLMKLPTLITR